MTHLVNPSGTVVKSYTYDPWGTASPGTGTVTSNIRFAGAYADPNGLTKFGARYYDPSTASVTITTLPGCEQTGRGHGS